MTFKASWWTLKRHPNMRRLWFAWYPVFTNDGIVWLDDVWVSWYPDDDLTGWDGVWCYERVNRRR